MKCKHGVVGPCEACAHPDYFCEHGVFGLEYCQACETEQTAKEFGCQIMGHDWKDVSEAGPDSGNMAVACTFCGEYHTNPLY